MRLYFQAGKKRLAIDTDRHTWSNNYWYLGGHRRYIKISAKDYGEILDEINSSSYSYDAEF